MPAIKGTLKNADGNNVYPATLTNEVYDETTGERLDNTISQINNDLLSL